MKQKEWRPGAPYRSLKASSKRILLRPLKISDFARWQSAYAARLPNQNQFDTDKRRVTKMSRKDFRKLLAQYAEAARIKRVFIFSIFDRKTGAHLGQTDLYLINREMRWANLGYSVHNYLWGQGYASEASRLSLQLAFGKMRLHRVEASCEVANLASARVALKAGLHPEGTRKKHFATKGGIDMRVFAQNAIDYKRLRLTRQKTPSAKGGTRRKLR